MGGGGGGGGGGREINWGKKTEGEKRKGIKKKTMETGRIEPSSSSRISIGKLLLKEPNALPVAYWDSPASLRTILNFYCVR